jgi:hypothetical protein
MLKDQVGRAWYFVVLVSVAFINVIIVQMIVLNV